MLNSNHQPPFSKWILTISFTFTLFLNPLDANPTKCSNTLKYCLSVFDHFVGLTLKELNFQWFCGKVYYSLTSKTLSPCMYSDQHRVLHIVVVLILKFYIYSFYGEVSIISIIYRFGISCFTFTVIAQLFLT